MLTSSFFNDPFLTPTTGFGGMGPMGRGFGGLGGGMFDQGAGLPALMGATTDLGDTNVGLWNWNRALAEPLMFGLEDLGDSYVIDIRRPTGLRRRDLHVELNGDVLTVSGEHSRRNRVVSFRRSVQLPGDVDKSKIQARYHQDGSLHIELAKGGLGAGKTIPIQGYERFSLPQGGPQQQLQGTQQQQQFGVGTQQQQRKEFEEQKMPSSSQQEGPFGLQQQGQAQGQQQSYGQQYGSGQQQGQQGTNIPIQQTS